MKRCPTCDRTFDDTQAFCSDDGTRLLEETPEEYDPQKTIMASHGAGSAPMPPPASDAPPKYQASPPPWTPPAAKSSSPLAGSSPLGGLAVPGAVGSKLVPAAAGGAAMGFLTALPVIGGGCCLWAILGGALATLLYVKKSPDPAQIADGAILGAIAGALGGIINIIIGLPLAYLIYGSNMTLTSGSASYGPGAYLALWAIGGFLGLVIFGAIGGIIGVTLFEKRKGDAGPTPPPPQNFGGQVGGSFR